MELGIEKGWSERSEKMGDKMILVIDNEAGNRIGLPIEVYMKRSKTTVRTKRLDLKKLSDGRYMDQYGRILEEYTNKEGKTDLKPVGVGSRSGDNTIPK